MDHAIATADSCAGDRCLDAGRVAAAAGLAPQAVRVVEAAESTSADLLRAPWAGDARVGGARVLIASRQTAGRGRRGRPWLTDPVLGLAMSVSAERDLAAGAPQLTGLSPAIGAAIAEALDREGTRVELKWPNDVFRNRRKCAGILVETRQLGARERVVVGIGINWVEGAADAAAVGQPVGGLFERLPALEARERAAGVLAAAVIAELARFFADGPGDLARRWSHFDALAGREVSVTDDAVELLRGTAEGLAPDGALRVRIGGRVERVTVGDVSVRRASEGPRQPAPEPPA